MRLLWPLSHGVAFLRRYIGRSGPSSPSMTDPVKASLGGAYARTRRAHEHILDLIARIEVVRQEQQQSCSVEIDTDPKRFGEPKLVLQKRIGIPVELGIIIGEAVYNLRSALDYLIYELAILDSGKIAEGTQFPIENKPKRFRWWKENRLQGLNGAHIAAIEGYQPYRGCDWTGTLRDFSNPDKHRQLTPHLGGFNARIWATDRLRFLNVSSGPVTSAIHPVSGNEVQMQFELTLEVLFPDGTQVVKTLRKLHAEVAQALEAFKPEFEPPDGGTHNSTP